MDTFSIVKRSQIMAAVKGKNTSPEKGVRSFLHNLGFRFRLNKKNLPGSPDIVLARYKTAIFVHGCFWHGHNCSRGKRPASNKSFWDKKLNRNIERDKAALSQIIKSGWYPIVIWECQTKNEKNLKNSLKKLIKMRFNDFS